MFTFLTIAALATLASAATLTREVPEGFLRSSAGRIVGGRNGTIEEVPHQVSLRVWDRHICGGSIISEHWILTAAHCTEDSSSVYSVRAGSTFANGIGGSEHFATKIVRHNGFNKNLDCPFSNDIALIRVEEPFQFDVTRQPIELFAENEESEVGSLATISGWGTTRFLERPTILQIVEVPIISKQNCSKAYVGMGGICDGQICAAYPEGGKDSCQGDSGGPFVIDGRLAGIVSWGKGCGVAGNPGVYTEVSAYRKWIESNARD